MWILFAALTVLFWGCSDVCFKKVMNDDSNVLDLIIYNGIFYFIVTLFYMLIKGFSFNIPAIIGYIPVGLSYIVAMFSYYAAFRYANVSIISPIAHTSCAITTLLCVFVLKQKLNLIQIIAIFVITIAVAILSNPDNDKKDTKEKIYLTGFFLALGYTLFDGLGSFLDEVFIDINVLEKNICTEDDVIVAYATIYFIAGIICYIVKLCKNNFKRKNNIIVKKEKVIDKWKLIGTLFETGGQYAYVYTYASQDAAIASPFIASACLVSILLSRIFLKEKMTKKQCILVALTVASMFVLSIE